MNTLRTRECKKVGIILENRAFQNLKLSENFHSKKCYAELIFEKVNSERLKWIFTFDFRKSDFY